VALGEVARLPRKQASTHEHWLAALDAAYTNPDHDRARALVARAVARIERWAGNRSRLAYGWSGGKDSQGLRIVCEAAGVSDCVLVISELEYPAFLAWATDHMPWGLTVEARPLDLAWLSRNPRMLFPPDAKIAARWFSLIQHAGQRTYCQRERVQMLLFGRRLADGNQCGTEGWYRPRDGAAERGSPMFDWTHEDLLCVLGAHAAPLPPCYGWPRGFRVGTGAWPARQWTGDRENGWREVYEIDRRVVQAAAEAAIPGAAEYLIGLA